MANIKVTAVQGLTEEDQIDYSWGDFYGDEDEQQQKKAETQKAEAKKENEAVYEDDFEEVEEEEAEEVEEELEQNKPKDVLRQGDNRGGSSRYTSTGSPRYTSTDKLHETDSQTSKKSKKKSKPKKAKTHPSSKPPPLSLYQDLVKERLLYSKDRMPPHNQDTMSDQEVGRRRGRRLHRRVQMKKCHSMEHAVEQAGRDRLEQKFIELEELMARPLTDTRRTHIPKQQVHRMMNMQHQHAELGHRGNNSQHRVGAWVEGTVQEEEEGQEDSQAYSTIRMLQTTGPNLHMQITYNSQHGAPGTEESHHLATNDRLKSKPPVPWRPKGSVDSSPSSSSGASQHRNDDDNTRKQNGYSHYSSDDEGEGNEDDDVTPRRVYITNEMHLKYSDNPKLLEWLKRKDAEYRRAKKAQRAKKREERNEKMVERELKIARREKSAERVKQWMEIKRKEAARRQKEERRRKKLEAQELAARRAKSPEGVLRGSRIDRPQSAPPASNKNNNNNNKKHIPIKRPESAARLDNGDGSAPKPPDSKFVYKRPVSGRVRLMKLQNARNAQARDADQKRYEELSAEEKEKRARTSYDAWLIAKRKQDIEKRKEAKQQKDLIKSDPEMERIIPELAARRIERIKSGKKSIDTGLSQIDKDANRRFGGGNFGEETGQSAEQKEVEGDSVPKPSSYKLAVNGASASLVEVNTRARPVSAKTRMPIPQSAFSPRRPQSAKAGRASSPKVKAVMDTDQSAQPNPFKLPFPDELGAPDHVKRVQERIFSKELTSRSGGSERPEPQGCASVESATCPKGVDGPKVDSCPKGMDASVSDAAPRASMVLLQEIEAEALQSEEAEHAALCAVQNVLQKETADGGLEQTSTTAEADEDSQERHTAQAEEEGDEKKPEQPAEDLEQETQDAGAEDSTEDRGDTSAQDGEQQQEEEENEEEGEEKEEGQDDEEEGEEKEEGQDDEEEEADEQREEQENEMEREEEERAGEEEEEGALHQEGTAEPESVTADEQEADATYEYEEEPEEQQREPEEQQAEEPTASQPGVGDGNENGPQDTELAEDEAGSEAEDSSRKLEKHVSFSEDLTVFEPGSTETSSNFEDERGYDEKEDEHYPSLDDTPDPQ